MSSVRIHKTPAAAGVTQGAMLKPRAYPTHTAVYACMEGTIGTTMPAQ